MASAMTVAQRLFFEWLNMHDDSRLAALYLLIFECCA